MSYEDESFEEEEVPVNETDFNEDDDFGSSIYRLYEEEDEREERSELHFE